MRVLLLNPPYREKLNNGFEKFFIRAGSRWPFSIRKKLTEKVLYKPFPFFLAYTAGLLVRQGHNVTVVDGVAMELDMNTFVELVLNIPAEVVVIEITPFSIYYDFYIVKRLKEKNSLIKSICVGPFVPFVLNTIRSDCPFDYIVFGEYEIAVAQILSSIETDAECKYPGVYTCHDLEKANEIKFTPLIEPLDQLGFPLREIFPSNTCPSIDTYWDGFCQFKPAVQMHSSRGCPFRCYFCLWNQIMYHNKYRVFSVEHVIREIQLVVGKFHAKEIYFDDDDFTVDKQRVIEICKEIIDRKIKVKWSCMGNAMNLDEETIYWMSKAGCIGVKFGVETGDEKLCRTVGKPLDLKKIKYITYLLHKYGIKSHSTFTFGLLGETKSSMVNTLKFATKLHTLSVQFSICTPYPFTKFFKVALKKGFIRNFDIRDLDGGGSCVINYPDLSSGEIKNFFRSAYKKWLFWQLLNILWIYRWIKIFVRIFFVGGRQSRKALYKAIVRVIKSWL